MKALISPNEIIYSQDGTALGFRIAQVSNSTFEVALPLFWTDCPDDCIPYNYYYSDGQFHVIPPPEPTEKNLGFLGILGQI